MKNNPNVSIIIPNYNGINYLENCLKSLKCQTYQNFEVIVVDNASTDNSVNYIVDNYPDFRVINAFTTSILTSSGLLTTADSATASYSRRADSTSNGLIR